MPEPKVYLGKRSDFTQDTDNANTGSPRGNALIELSLREYGAGRSLVADANGVLIGGNKTHLQAEHAGMDDVIVVETDGSQLVVVKRTDLDLTADDKARELAYMDNRASEASLTWNPDQVAADIANGVDLSLMFYDDELDQILGQVLPDEDPGDLDQEAFPEMELQPFEHYDYLVLVFRDSFDWSQALDRFGIEKEGFTVTRKQRKIGLCRVVDGRKVLAQCGSSSPAGDE